MKIKRPKKKKLKVVSPTKDSRVYELLVERKEKGLSIGEAGEFIPKDVNLYIEFQLLREKKFIVLHEVVEDGILAYRYYLKGCAPRQNKEKTCRRKRRKSKRASVQSLRLKISSSGRRSKLRLPSKRPRIFVTKSGPSGKD